MTDAPTHEKIMPAIAAAMGQVQKVGKEGRNEHDRYNFASIDDFLALVNPICAANGLIVSMQESNIEDFARKGKYGENAWLRVTWEITVYHTSGQSLPPVLRTVEVLRNGAQAYGSAQSYALKQFLRSLFLIPTGDKDDADLQPTDAGTVSAAAKAPPKAEKKPDVEAETTWFNAILPTVKDADGVNALLPRAKAAGREVQQLVVQRANALGLEFDANARRYVYLEQADDSKAEREHDAAVRDQ